jgi:hypothetical protein
MILQVGGVGNLISGILAVTAGDSIDGEGRKGKFDFQ